MTGAADGWGSLPRLGESELIVSPQVASPSGTVVPREADSVARVGEVLIATEIFMMWPGALFFFGAPDVFPDAFLFSLLATVPDLAVIRSDTFTTTQERCIII